ncbi:MAG: fumarate reductase subunit C [candidate division KSB1 bacterium]|nr:fumarate reductase subunit C [candidate division KSB1 bacterium]
MTSQNPQYTKYHPKWHRVRMPIFWWVHKWVHTKFILRELTSVAVALYAVVLLFQIRAVAQGPEAYTHFLVWLQTPVSIGLHAIAFLFVLFHSVTWFNLAPRALVLRIGQKRIPDAMIAASNYVAWIIFSAAIAWRMLN